MGAWIEIYPFRSRCDPVKSLPSWERGLKFELLSPCQNPRLVAPLVGAWIEIITHCSLLSVHRSLPSWERGLKYKLPPLCPTNFYTSLPSWERGLKSRLLWSVDDSLPVAPLVGAWIEMMKSARRYSSQKSLPSWERGLKYNLQEQVDDLRESRSPRGSVD